MNSLKFFLLVYSISIPFWILGLNHSKLTPFIPVNLPISALMFICPMLAAIGMTYKESHSSGVKKLLWRVLDYNKIRPKRWYIAVLFFIPGIILLSYITMYLMRIPMPGFSLPWQMFPVFLFIFLISAAAEEIGWSAYVIDSMQNQLGKIAATIVLGILWAIWHIIPNIQADHGFNWIVWQCLSTIAFRIIIVWIYNNTNRSVFAALVSHATINISIFSLPDYGSNYNPRITGIISLGIAMVLLIKYLLGMKKPRWFIQ